MLPRLEAQERRAAIGDIAIGTVNADPGEARRVRAELARTAEGGERQRAPRASAADLAAIGVAMTIVGSAHG